MQLSEQFKEYFDLIKNIVKSLDKDIENGKEIVIDMIMFLVMADKFTSEYNKLIENERNEEEK